VGCRRHARIDAFAARVKAEFRRLAADPIFNVRIRR